MPSPRIVLGSVETVLARDAAAAAKQLPGEAGRDTLGLGTATPPLPSLASLTPEVLEARLAEAEAAESGARLPAEPAALAPYHPALQQPPQGVAAGARLWSEYVAYWEKRYAELDAAHRARRPPSDKPPLPWPAYSAFRRRFAEALAFQRSIAALLRAEAALPPAQRTLLRNFRVALVEENVGVSKADTLSTRYADQLVLELDTAPGQLPQVETFSNKQRDLTNMGVEELVAQFTADANDAILYYGETLRVMRPSLKPLMNKPVQVRKVHLVYDARFKPVKAGVLEAALKRVAGGVEIHFR